MLEFNSLTSEKHVLIVNALNAAIGHADVFPMLFPLYDGRDTPTASEAAVTTEFCRYCLQNQHVPSGWESQFAIILNSIAYLWSNMLEDQDKGTVDISWFYGIKVTRADVEMLESLAAVFSKASNE